MYAIYIALVIAMSIFALLGTIYVGKQTNKSEGVEVSGDSQSISSTQRQKKSSSIKILSIIYGITFLVTAVIIAIFII